MNTFIKKILDEPIINDPWPHQIIADLLDPTLFNKVEQQCQKLLLLSNDYFQLYQKDFEKYNLDLKDEVGGISEAIFSNYESIIQLYPYYRDSKNLRKKRMDIHLNISPPLPFRHSIHDELPDKVLSIALYIAPTLNKGTLMYTDNDEKTLVKTVPWKPNSAFIFCGKNQSTWHSFESDDTNNRITLNCFIRT
jgi:hypothetical protein